MNVRFPHAKTDLPAACLGGVARLRIIETLSEAEPIWRSLEASGAVFTPYQRYDWTAAWQHHVGSRSGLVPFIVVGYSAADEPLFLWPLVRNRGAVSIARFFGAKHANFKFALWRPEAAAALESDGLQAILREIAASPDRPDLLALCDQPEAWQGLRNPLLLLPHQPSPSFASCGGLEPDFEQLAQTRLSTSKRKKLRNRERLLSSFGEIRFWRADNAADAKRVLHAFHQQKAERMRELGLGNVFAAPGVPEFIQAAATDQLDAGRAALELYVLSVNDTIAATYAGMINGHRLCLMFNSIIRGPMAQGSPGQILLMNVLRQACERGLKQIDLGVGEANYKETFCDKLEPLFDCFIPLTARGAAVAPAFRAAYRLKGAIKRQPYIWGKLQDTRRFVSRFT